LLLIVVLMLVTASVTSLILAVGPAEKAASALPRKILLISAAERESRPRFVLREQT